MTTETKGLGPHTYQKGPENLCIHAADDGEVCCFPEEDHDATIEELVRIRNQMDKAVVEKLKGDFKV